MPAQGIPFEEAWTVKDVARYLRLSEQTVYTMTASKSIPFFKIGGSVRFDPPEVVAWRKGYHQGPEI